MVEQSILETLEVELSKFAKYRYGWYLIGLVALVFSMTYVADRYTLPIGGSIKDAAIVVTGVGGLWAALVGIDTWRRQLAGTSRHDAALKVLNALQSLVEELSLARRAFVGVDEKAGRPRSVHESPDESPKVTAVFDESYAYDKRLTRVTEAAGGLHEAEKNARSLIGDKTSSELKPIYECVEELRRDKFLYYMDQLDRAHAGQSPVYPEPTLYCKVFRKADDDRFGEKVSQAAKTAKEYFGSFIK